MKRAVAGFQSLPTELQHKILDLAATDSSTGATLRCVSRSFEAHARIRARSITTIALEDPTGGTPLARLPYIPRLTAIQCSTNNLDLSSTRFVDGVLTARLPAWPDLASLEVHLAVDYAPMFLIQLHTATRLTYLSLIAQSQDAAAHSQDAAMPDDHWTQVLTRALPLLQNLQSLVLVCRVPPGSAEPRLFDHLSALQGLTSLIFEAFSDDAGATAAFTSALGSLTKLAILQLGDWPSSASEADSASWQALMARVCTLPDLQELHFEYWQLDTSCSAAYFSELGPVLKSLTALTCLCLAGTYRRLLHAAPPNAAGTALVRDIGSLDQLQTLTLSALSDLGLCACCQHLARLTNLTRLGLVTLGVTAPPDVPAWMPSAADGSFEQLLTGMTQLRVLELVDV